VEEVIDVAVRSWMLEQLANVEQHQPGIVDGTVKGLLAQQRDLRGSVGVCAYLDGGIHLRKATGLSGMHRLELQVWFIARSLPVHTGPDSVQEAGPEPAARDSSEGPTAVENASRSRS
jgi:hypothetical protein